MKRDWWFRPQPMLRPLVVIALIIFFFVFQQRFFDLNPVMLMFVIGLGGGAAAALVFLFKKSKLVNASGATPGWISHFTSAEMQDISAHLTEAEKLAVKKYGGWFGIWNSATFFLPMACVWCIPIPVPLNWIIAALVLLVGLAFYPVWWKKEANLLCSTAWARERGYHPDTLRLSPFRSTGIMLLGGAAFLFLAVCWWQTYRPEGVWLEALSPASIKEPAGGATIRVTEVKQHGQTVFVRILCDQIPNGGELRPVFDGPLFALPYDLPAEVTNVDCLLMPAPHTFEGTIVAGTNLLSGKPDFLLGFMLPDEQAAAAAVRQVQKLNLGQLHGVESPLFILQRNLGKDAKGIAIYDKIDCWIGMQAKAVTRKPKSAAQNLSFGPVVERVLPCEMPLRFLSGINLDSGRIETISFGTNDVPPGGQTGEDYFREKGVDMTAIGDLKLMPQSSGLNCTLGTFAMPVKESDWDSAPAAAVLAHATNLSTMSEPFKNTPEFFKMTVILMSEDSVFPKTFIFHTRIGGMGILQITGFTENPRGVKLRYKLVQSPATTIPLPPGYAPGQPVPLPPGYERGQAPPMPPAYQLAHNPAVAPPAAAPNLSFGPVMERVVNDSLDAKGQDMFLGLASGLLGSEPTNPLILSNFPAMEEWMNHNGLDFQAVNQRAAWNEAIATAFDDWFFKASGQHLPPSPMKGICCVDMSMQQFDSVEWNSLSPNGLIVAMKNSPASPLRFYSAADELPLTWGFKTHAGAIGLLQITGFTENPRGVKLRYKLVHNSHGGN